VWVPPTGCSPSGTGCSSVGPHRVTSSASKPAPVWASLSTDPQVLAGACCSTVSPWGHSFLQASDCSGVGTFPWATGGYVLHHELPWTTGGQPAFPMVFITSCKGRVHAPTFQAPPPPPSSLILVSAELFLSHRLTPLSSPLFHLSFFLPLLNYVIPEALQPTLIGLALASVGSILQLAAIGSIRHGRRL